MEKGVKWNSIQIMLEKSESVILLVFQVAVAKFEKIAGKRKVSNSRGDFS